MPGEVSAFMTSEDIFRPSEPSVPHLNPLISEKIEFRILLIRSVLCIGFVCSVGPSLITVTQSLSGSDLMKSGNLDLMIEQKISSEMSTTKM